MKKVLVFILGERTKNGEYAYKKQTFKTTYPQERPTFDEWCKQLKVSCLHGKRVVHLDY